jgi:Bifunctional DNA primase/polymerase, N-terminal
MNNNTKTLTVSDVYTCAFMLVSGARLARVLPGGLVRWVFDDADGTATRLRDLYLSGETCLADARELSTSTRGSVATPSLSRRPERGSNDEQQTSSVGTGEPWLCCLPPGAGSKQPLKGIKWQEQATSNTEQVEQRWDRMPTANIGVRIPEDVTVLDVDMYKAANDAEREELAGLVPLAGRTVRAKSGNGGYHLYFKAAALPKPAPYAVDIRQGGASYMVVPPSVNDGGAYS